MSLIETKIYFHVKFLLFRPIISRLWKRVQFQSCERSGSYRAVFKFGWESKELPESGDLSWM